MARNTHTQAPFGVYIHHPVEDIEPVEEGADSAELIARILRHFSTMRGLGAARLGDEVAAISGIALPDCFPGGWRAPMLQLEKEERAALKGMEEFWAWLCMLGRRPRLSAVGHRALAALYVLRPDLLDGVALEELGSACGITRQALSKLVSDFRDCFGGVRNRTMKSDETRARCRAARRKPFRL
jgi:hypothetical protein